MKVTFKKLTAGPKKMEALFYDNDGILVKRTKFGSAIHEDYTMHANKDRRVRFLARNKHRDISDPQTAGALAVGILWGNSTNINDNIAAYKKKYNLS